jgi:hypothetical protein
MEKRAHCEAEVTGLKMKELVPENQMTLRGTRGIQQTLFSPPVARLNTTLEQKGVVYTKRWVVEFLLDLCGYRAETNLVDLLAIEPCAGDGAFIVPMIGRLVASCRQLSRPLSDCKKSLKAFELDDKSAERTRRIAALALEKHGVELSVAEDLASAWIQTGDYLTDAVELEADIVIGNPPYVRLEDIPDETADLYRDAYPTMRGRADLYVAFFEAALRSLRPNGVCAFICADRWMRNQYGAELRELITSAFAVDVVIEMHNADPFQEEVDAYPAVTVIRRSGQGRAVIASLDSQAEHTGSTELYAAIRAASLGDPVPPICGLQTAAIDTWFNAGDPWPCRSPSQLALLRRIEERFPALEAQAKVGIGVATGNDDVFVTKDATLVEPTRLLKLALAKDIADGAVKWSGHFLVDPWNGDGLVPLKDYPLLQSYLVSHAKALKRRHTAAKNTDGWYRTIDRVNHDLTLTRKLFIADIKNVLAPVLDRGETYPHHNLYHIQSDDWDLEVLGGLLMSAISQFFVEAYGVRMRGGYLRFQAQYLRRIRVPDPRTIDGATARGLVDAFRRRDRELATRISLQVYGVDPQLMETVLGS